MEKKEIRKRKPVKSLTTGEIDPELRNAKSENMGELRESYEKRELPLLSMKTKEKEFIWGLHREGKLYV